MTLERTDKELVIHIPESLDIELLQDFIDYIKAKTIIMKSQARESDISELTDEINKNLKSLNKKRFLNENHS